MTQDGVPDSHGALTVTHHHHALSDIGTRNSIVLGAWLKDTHLVPKPDLIELFRNKSLQLASGSVDDDESMSNI